VKFFFQCLNGRNPRSVHVTIKVVNSRVFRNLAFFMIM
jgi:hypothetical protein